MLTMMIIVKIQYGSLIYKVDFVLDVEKWQLVENHVLNVNLVFVDLANQLIMQVFVKIKLTNIIASLLSV